jgi:predicted RNA-binding Zn-ribbon protein involved in translation (DUF1610 family)
MWTLLQIALSVLLGLPLLLIALALAGASLGHLSLQRSIEIAALSSCPNCGEAIGRAAVRAGYERKAQKVRAIMERYLRPRVPPEWEIECPHCGSTFLFDPNENRIDARSVAPDAAKI